MPIGSTEIQAMSYRYLRIAMVGLLLALAAAVFSQKDSFLASVSAYYYTPADNASGNASSVPRTGIQAVLPALR